MPQAASLRDAARTGYSPASGWKGRSSGAGPTSGGKRQMLALVVKGAQGRRADVSAPFLDGRPTP